jgi:Tfp pilus assembly protein PilF
MKTDLYKTAEEALTLFPNSVLVNYFVGITTLEKKEYNKAKTALENVAMMSYDNKTLTEEAFTRLGELYNETKEYDKSDKNFEKAIAMNAKNALARNNFAYYLSLRNERLDKAEAMSKESLELEPNNPSYLDTYGWIRYQQGNYDDALLYINKAIDNGGGNSPDVLEHAGDVNFKLGKPEKALEYWKKSLEKGNSSQALPMKINSQKL